MKKAYFFLLEDRLIFFIVGDEERLLIGFFIYSELEEENKSEPRSE
jgi:hypothetical protein